MTLDQATSPAPGSAQAHGTRRRRPGWLGPAVLLLVVGAALLVGSGALSTTPQDAAQRAASLETTIRCPSCIDVSVADSQVATAATLRHQILQWERQGLSSQQIDNIVVGRYGPSILLIPPSSGLSSLLWIVPVVGAVVALAALGTLFWRRSRQLDAWRLPGRPDGRVRR